MNQVSFARVAEATMLVALLILGRAAEAKSTIELCNAGNTALSIVAIGDHPGGGWTISGWRTIQEGGCAAFDAIYDLKIGFAITNASGQRGMQVYDPRISPEICAQIASSYCVPPTGNFSRRHDRLLGLTECQPGDVLARFAFDFKAMPGNAARVQLPADENGEIIPFQQPTVANQSFPPFLPNQGAFPPGTGFELAMRGLADQQERLRLRIERQDPSQTAYWRVFYFRELGIVARPETHVASVAKNSPAGQAGLSRGDEVVRIDQVSVQSAWHARSLFVRTRPGETYAITVLRGAELHTQEITLDALPANLALTELHPMQGWLGVEFQSAVRVVGVTFQDGKPHLEVGDDILKIGRSDFDGVDGLARWLNRDLDARTVELQVRRAATGRITVMTLDKLK